MGQREMREFLSRKKGRQETKWGGRPGSCTSVIPVPSPFPFPCFSWFCTSKMAGTYPRRLFEAAEAYPKVSKQKLPYLKVLWDSSPLPRAALQPGSGPTAVPLIQGPQMWLEIIISGGASLLEVTMTPLTATVPRTPKKFPGLPGLPGKRNAIKPMRYRSGLSISIATQLPKAFPITQSSDSCCSFPF